jgi:hypothetical protein
VEKIGRRAELPVRKRRESRVVRSGRYPLAYAAVFYKLCAMRRTLDWFSGLNVIQKVLAVLFAALLMFSASYLVTSGFLWLAGAGDRADSPVEEGAVPEGASAGSTGTASASPGSSTPASTGPDFAIEIASARWEGGKAVVEGTWSGDLAISSVHCDLLEGGESGRSTDWWDRSVGTDMSFSKRTFSQEFVQAEGRKIEAPIDPESSYWVLCSGQFSGGWSMTDTAPVKGTPPAKAQKRS